MSVAMRAVFYLYGENYAKFSRIVANAAFDAPLVYRTGPFSPAPSLLVLSVMYDFKLENYRILIWQTSARSPTHFCANTPAPWWSAASAVTRTSVAALKKKRGEKEK